MKVFAVRRVNTFMGRPQLCTDHRDLFHGRTCPNRHRDDYIIPGEAPGVPLLLMRSAHWRPDVFEPARLVVCDAVRSKLSWVPHIEFRPVKFVKLFDFPYYPPGDFSFSDHPLWKKVVREGHANRLFERLPDVPELHRDFPPYCELIPSAARLETPHSPAEKQVLVPMPEGSGGPKEVMLSEELMRDYPILGWSYTLFNEAVFPLISPHLDRNYFDVVEVEI